MLVVGSGWWPMRVCVKWEIGIGVICNRSRRSKRMGGRAKGPRDAKPIMRVLSLCGAYIQKKRNKSSTPAIK